mgnify:CR=1 FL=1
MVGVGLVCGEGFSVVLYISLYISLMPMLEVVRVYMAGKLLNYLVCNYAMSLFLSYYLTENAQTRLSSLIV